MNDHRLLRIGAVAAITRGGAMRSPKEEDMRTKLLLLLVATASVGLVVAAPASASGPAAPGKELIQASCDGLGTTAISVQRGAYANGAAQIVDAKGHAIGVEATYTLTDLTTATVLDSETTATGQGNGHPASQPRTAPASSSGGQRPTSSRRTSRRTSHQRTPSSSRSTLSPSSSRSRPRSANIRAEEEHHEKAHRNALATGRGAADTGDDAGAAGGSRGKRQPVGYRLRRVRGRAAHRLCGAGLR